MSKNIVVTGGGKGLGYCIVQKHLEQGDSVFALEYRITQQLIDLSEKYPLLSISPCDVSSTQSVNTALSSLRQRISGVDILYNVAGIYFQDDTVALEESDIDRCLSLYHVNALGQLRVMAALSPLFHSGSVIINVTSEAGSVSSCTRTSEYGYSMSKAAANMGSKIFANQAADRNIRIFCIHPGWLKTDMGGTGALLSDTSISPQQSADALIEIAQDPASIPSEIMYLDYERNPLCW